MRSTILIVDDELSIRKLLDFYLGRNYNVVTMSDAMEAMDWLKSGNKPDAIIVDIELPIVNGKDFLSSIRSERKMNNIPVIMISGKEQSSYKAECFMLGADDYFVKPFNPRDMEERIVSLIQRFKMLYA